ncbi:MAG: two-component system LytT family response regulator [Saprospiraceae bacterium]|jgi:two-component system LytT family response regulator
MIKAIIIDDELHSRETTRMMADAIPNKIEIIGTAANAIEGVKLITDTDPDLIFLDVQMPEITGMQMLEMVPAYEGEIIFVTAHDHYAVQAFKKGALHYLLKPLDPEELEEAVSRVGKIVNSKSEKSKGNWLSLSTHEGWIVVKKTDIIRVESYKNYSTIVTNSVTHTISKTMKDVEAILPDAAFYRVHNTHIVHFNFIDKILKADGGNVLMQNGDLVPISKGKKKEFFDWFKNRIDSI